MPLDRTGLDLSIERVHISSWGLLQKVELHSPLRTDQEMSGP